jgi:signal peptidase II
VQEEGGAALTSPSDLTPSAPPVARRGAFVTVAILCALLTLAVDQGTKAWALTALTPGTPVELLGPFLRLSLVRNAGAAFSLGDGRTWLLTAFAHGVTVYVWRLIRRTTSRAWAVALGFILGGAVGNLVDRLLREPGPGRGHVVDFIDYRVFVGNVADIAIVGAAVAMVLLALRSIPLQGNAVRPRHEEPKDA